MSEIAILVRQIEIVIVNERLRFKKVVRLVAIDRRSKHHRNRDRIEERRDDRRAVRAPSHAGLICQGDENKKRRGDANAECHHCKIRINVETKWAGDDGERAEGVP